MRLLLFIIIPLSLLGCASEVVQYKEVYLPQKCEVVKRERPKREGSLSFQVASIFAYVEVLEQDLKLCRGEE